MNTSSKGNTQNLNLVLVLSIGKYKPLCVLQDCRSVSSEQQFLDMVNTELIEQKQYYTKAIQHLQNYNTITANEEINSYTNFITNGEIKDVPLDKNDLIYNNSFLIPFYLRREKVLHHVYLPLPNYDLHFIFLTGNN